MPAVVPNIKKQPSKDLLFILFRVFDTQIQIK